MLKGLGIGADDCITKQFSLRILLARAEAVLRRMNSDPVPLYSKNSLHGRDLEIAFDQHVIKKEGTGSQPDPQSS